METLDIIRNVNRLPLPQQMWVAERIIHSIRQRDQPSMEMAAEHLSADYATDENQLLSTVEEPALAYIYSTEHRTNFEIKETPVKLSEKFRGALSKEAAKSFMEHTRNMREEWNDI